MPIAESESIVGYQTVMGGIPNDSVLIYCESPGPSTAAPKVVGYWYFMLVTPARTNARTVLARGLFYQPGFVLAVPQVRVNPEDYYEFNVNWPRSGIPYFVYIGI